MRLEILNTGHRLKHKAMFAVMKLMTRQRVPDVVKTLTYRPDFFGNPLNECFQLAMRGDSPWSIPPPGSVHVPATLKPVDETRASSTSSRPSWTRRSRARAEIRCLRTGSWEVIRATPASPGSR